MAALACGRSLVPTIVELLNARRPQDDEPGRPSSPHVRVLHRVGPGASREQVSTIVDAQRQLGLAAALESPVTRDVGRAGAWETPSSSQVADVLHVHGAHDDTGLKDAACVVVVGARNSRLTAIDSGTHVVAESRQHADALVRAGVTQSAVHVVLPSVPVDAWRLARREPARGQGFVVGLIATKQPAAWVPAAVDALLPVLASRPGAEIWVGGAAALAATSSWTSVAAMPVVRRMDAVGAAAVGRMDVVVCLDQSVVLPLPLLAAMQLRRPIVASRIGACREVLDNGVSALLVQPNDITALVASVTRLVQRPMDRATLGGAAADVAALQHAPARVAGRLARLYGQLLADAGCDIQAAPATGTAGDAATSDPAA